MSILCIVFTKRKKRKEKKNIVFHLRGSFIFIFIFVSYNFSILNIKCSLGMFFSKKEKEKRNVI